MGDLAGRVMSRKPGDTAGGSWFSLENLASFAVGGVKATASGQGGSLAKCFGKVLRQEANSVSEGTGLQNLGWDKRMPQGPVSF